MNTIKWRKPSYLAVSLVAALSGCNIEDSSANAGQLEPGGYMYFFEQGLPTSITTDSVEPLTVSNEHYKDGEHALKWSFTPNSQLVFSQDIGYQEDDSEITPYTFMAWIYNETPSDQSLTFEFSIDGEQQSQFSYGLNFKGWRGISVPFRDMDGLPIAGMNRLTVTAPDTNGTIYLDEAMMAVPVDNRWPTADIQQPFVNPNVVDMASKNWTALLMYDQMLHEQQPSFNFDLNFDDSQGDTAILYQNFDKHLGVSTTQNVSQEKIDANLEKYNAFMIHQNQDGSYVGKPLDHPKRQNFLKTGIVSDDTLGMLTDTMNIRDLGKAMLETAKYLRSESLSADNRSALEQTFIDAARYAFDQGWEGGSGFQIITHVGYQTREFFDALFVGRQLLADNHLLESAQQSMMWFNATGRIYEQDKDINSSNVDILNTQLQWMTKSFLLLPDQTERQTMLHQLQSWLSTTLLRSDGVGGGFKPDGSTFHHSQHYPAYGNDAFSGLSGVIFGLSHSDYEVSQQAHERIKDALLKMRVYTKETQTPIVLSGRHPDGKQKISATPFKWLAQSGSPDQSSPIDQELAAAYANLTDKTSYEGVLAENEPTGVWAMNYASMALARGASSVDDTQSWLAIARGFSRYLVGNETYEADNLYGRYLQYGQLEITPADLGKRAFSHDGWDWNRYPGTTTIQLPNDKLRAQLNQLPGAGIEEMLLSTETNSGGNTLGNDNAMFAMTLHGHKKYEQQSFYAHKSYFIFGNQVVALGSDISNDIAQYETQTTLFQHSVKNLEPVEINGQLIDTLGTDAVYSEETTLLDPAGNRYFVDDSDGQQIHFTYQIQYSNDQADGKATTGQFATAVIDHGAAPTNAGYEYAIKIDAQDDVKPVYEVLQKDHNLHAIRTEQGVEDYAFFNPTQTNHSGWVESSESVSQIMLQANSTEDQLSLSVVNPDLALYQGQDPDQIDENGDQVEVSIYDRDWRFNLSQAVISEFTIKGQWQLIGINNNVSTEIISDDTSVSTKVRVTTTDGIPEQFMLQKA